jgi:hypothetical protein
MHTLTALSLLHLNHRLFHHISRHLIYFSSRSFLIPDDANIIYYYFSHSQKGDMRSCRCIAWDEGVENNDTINPAGAGEGEKRFAAFLFVLRDSEHLSILISNQNGIIIILKNAHSHAHKQGKQRLSCGSKQVLRHLLLPLIQYSLPSDNILPACTANELAPILCLLLSCNSPNGTKTCLPTKLVKHFEQKAAAVLPLLPTRSSGL